MIIVGLILVLLGIFTVVKFLFWLGLILLIAGLVLNLNPPVDGRRRRYW